MKFFIKAKLFWVAIFLFLGACRANVNSTSSVTRQSDLKKELQTQIEKSFFKGVEFTSKQEYQRALPIFEEITRRYPSHAMAWYLLGECYHYVREAELLRKTASGSGGVEVFEESEKAKNAYIRALVLFKERLPKGVDESNIWYLIGNSYYYIAPLTWPVNQLPYEMYMAFYAYKKALQVNSACLDCYRKLGHIYSDLALFDDAIAMYKKALAIQPYDVKTHFSLGRAYVSTGEKHMAVQEYNILSDLDISWADKLLSIYFLRWRSFPEE